jgi:hypothetical protein
MPGAEKEPPMTFPDLSRQISPEWPLSLYLVVRPRFTTV